ncbi:MFS family permease [Kribbella aluminosa]|uniref:MFS family permease n=1 Tax=Kribbella aluminosa TaxID=416017 RepID=A0ABS4UYB9_9ACTN|nr:MFS transporter [Kribbella aluminosa]MBP2356631.1 MFS family permease [Kribbella aluminosa]
MLHNGWWLVTSVYLVVDTGLSPAELVLVDSVQSAFALLLEVPAGVIADTISREWSLVISQVLMGTAMLATGLFTSFPALLATQVLCGIWWTFASGSDVALMTDELDDPGTMHPRPRPTTRWPRWPACSACCCSDSHPTRSSARSPSY